MLWYVALTACLVDKLLWRWKVFSYRRLKLAVFADFRKVFRGVVLQKQLEGSCRGFPLTEAFRKSEVGQQRRGVN